MKKNICKKTVTFMAAITMAGMLLAGCGSDGNAVSDPSTEQTAAEEDTAETADTEQAGGESAEADAAAEASEGAYFKKGVYVNYAKEAENPPMTYFYVFSDDTYGYTADGEAGGIGLPFDITQTDGKVKFSFGGSGESEDTLVITSADNGIVCGYFEDIPERELVFEPLTGADPESFSAENYVNGPEESVYHDANGWSIRYDADKFEITPGGPETFIVYTGESAGTNMITVTYTVDNKGEAAIKELGESYSDDAIYTEGPFPGADDVNGYWVTVPVDTEGSGSYMTAMGRDFMDGALIFRVDGHQGDDEEMNMRVSDEIAAVIDSLTFD